MTTSTEHRNLIGSFRLVAAHTYLEELVHEVERARRRVVLLALLIVCDATTERLFDALAAALGRGVEVRIILDEYYTKSYLIARNSQWQQTVRRLEELRRAGAVVHGLKGASLNPFKGRCHTKFTLVDDSIYGFGGVNISDKAIRNTDYMLRRTSKHMADKLYTLCLATEAHAVGADAEFEVDDDSTALVDAGIPGESIIYDRARELADQAKTVYYVSQFCPTGPLATSLRSTSTICYFNQSARGGPHIGAMLTVDKAISGLRTSYRGTAYLHAKFMLAELFDGSRVLLSGSHNFKYQGVRYGTMETALYSRDQRLWNQLYRYLITEIDNVSQHAPSTSTP